MQQAMSTVDGKIDYINSHGTSTPAGDIQELKAMKETFGTEMPPVSSTKSLAGHSLGATGVQEAIYCLLMQENNFICASANIEEIDPEAEGLPVVTSRKDGVDLQRVMSNSFGFGGTNSTLVFEKYNG
jgi:3-oxoacyl-[acyl-carrier-protein] synthase-1